MSRILFFKSHNKGYTKKDGTYVAPFDDKRSKRNVLVHSSRGAFTIDDEIYNKPDGREIQPYKGMGDAMARYMLKLDGDVDIMVWHGTSQKYLESILAEGIKPSEKGSVRESDIGKTFVAGDRKDARTFAQYAIERNPGVDAVVLAIRVPAEASNRFDNYQNGVESFINIEDGVPPEWIVGYQVVSKDVDGKYRYRYEKLAKSEVDDGANLFIVSLCDNGEMLTKSHVKGHMRAGKWVSDYDNTVSKKPSTVGSYFGKFSSPFGGGNTKGSTYVAPKPKAFHPKLNDEGKQVGLINPHEPSAKTTWDDPEAVATFVPGGEAPATLNGVALSPWEDVPKTLFDWANVDGQDVHDEPPMDEEGFHKIGAGVVVTEPDGRVWVIHPSNKFGGYKASFPKGTVEDGLPLQASAIKEAYEESGLKVELTGFLMDVDRTTSRARYYTAKRVGGTPTDAGWESQAVSLTPVGDLYKLLNMSTDHGIAEAIGAGPAPTVAAKPSYQGQSSIKF